MRGNKNDLQRENALIFNQVLSTHSVRKCMEISLENFFVDIGASRVNRELDNRDTVPFRMVGQYHVVTPLR